jgi:hypothetical protein
VNVKGDPVVSDKKVNADSNDPASQPATVPDDIQKIVDAKLAEAKAEMKSKLDSAYASRDAAVSRVAELETQEQERESARLKAAGEHEKAYKLDLEAANNARLAAEARAEAIQKRNTELTRDAEVRAALASVGKEFRNDVALDTAFSQIVNQLVKDESGVWVSKDGKSIGQAVEAFTSLDKHDFLFKAKPSSGLGHETPSGNAKGANSKSLFDLDQSQVLQMAQQGKLPNQRR